MIRAAFFDVDGTLFSHRIHRVPDSAMKALRELREKGVLLFVASGRSVTEVNRLLPPELLFDGYITLNGQYCCARDEVFFDRPVSKEEISRMLEKVEQDPFPLVFVENGRIYINYINAHVEKVEADISTPLPKVQDLREGLQHPVYQMIPFVLRDREDEIMACLPNCRKSRWHEGAFDIMDKDGGKGNGIRRVLERYGISRDEAMAFGDGENDLDMFPCVGISVAMGNAGEQTKRQADYVTDDIDKDGILKALQHFGILE